MTKINVPIIYHGNAEKLEKIDKGDCIDVRCTEALRVITKHRIIEPGYGGVIETLDNLPTLERKTINEKLTIEKGRFDGETVRFIRYNAGDYLLLNLGISMKLPEGKSALMLPRGGTFKNYGLIQTNSPGVIDESYNGTDDIWFMPVYALRDGFIIIGERVGQIMFIDHQMKNYIFTEVDKLESVNRGGHSSTGTI